MNYQNAKFGLQLSHRNQYGTEHVTLEFVRREVGERTPYSCCSTYDENYPAHLRGMYFYGLQTDGWVADYHCKMICFQPEYSGQSSINLDTAQRMTKTLRKLASAIEKTHAEDDPGDVLLAIVTALKLDFIVERKVSDTYETEYVYMGISTGRARYRELIAEASERVKAKVAAKEAEKAAS